VRVKKARLDAGFAASCNETLPTKGLARPWSSCRTRNAERCRGPAVFSRGLALTPALGTTYSYATCHCVAGWRGYDSPFCPPARHGAFLLPSPAGWRKVAGGPHLSSWHVPELEFMEVCPCWSSRGVSGKRLSSTATSR